ncbi:MAG: amino acid adenylation domain-containing protein [Polyangiaceae bacterium]
MRELMTVGDHHEVVEPCLHQLFERAVLAHGTRPALVWSSGSLEYAALDRQANQLARYLAAQGIGPESRVGICVGRSVELVLSILAVLKTGAAFVPLDPDYPPARLAFMLEDSRPHALLTREDEVALLPDPARATVLERHFAAITELSTTPLASGVTAGNLAYVIYTSGSTGAPKGIALAHRGVVNNICDLNRRYAVGPADVLLSVSALGFDMSVYEILGTLAAGATLVLPDAGDTRDPDEIATLVARYGVTIWNSAPALLDALLSHESARASSRLGSLRLALLGGDWSPLALPARLKRLAPAALFVNLGGATEASIHSTLFEVSEVDPSWRSLPYGRAMAGQRVYVLDERLDPVPDGEIGDLYLAGVGLGRGYHARPDLTAERFLPDPYRAGERMYRTGDRVRTLPDGNLELIGRSDHQVKIRGVRVELTEVEAALARQPEVERAVAMVRRDVPDDPTLVAYVVTRQDSDGLGQELRCRMASELPPAFVPAHVLRLPALPLTPNGKLDRAALPAPGVSAGGATARTPLHSTIARMASELLGVAEVSTSESWFALGAHSLFLARLGARIASELGATVGVRELAAARSVEGAAELVEVARARTAAPPAPIPRVQGGDRVRATSSQERLFYLEGLCTDGPRPYNEVLRLELRGPVDADCLERSLRQLAQRHEALRSRLCLERGELWHVVDLPAEAVVAREDLSELDDGARRERIAVACREEGRRPFDLARGPLFRTRLLRLSTSESVVLLTLHHVVNDGWSNAILVRDWALLYAAERRGVTAELPELPLRYRDYASWQRASLAGPALAERLDFFRSRLDGAQTDLALPRDRRRPNSAGFAGARVALELGRELSERIEAFARGEEQTTFVTLFTLFQMLLARLSGQHDFLLGTVAANRPRAELEDVVGFFSNTVVVRAALDARAGLRELVGRTAKDWAEFSLRDDTPLDAVVAELAGGRRSGQNPLFQALFVLHDTPLAPTRFGDLLVESELPDSGASKFDLTLTLSRKHGELSGHLEYDSALFDASTASRWAELFRRLTEGALREPDRAFLRIPLSSPADHAELRVRRDSHELATEAATLPELFRRAATLHVDRPALRQGQREMRFRELDERSNRLAHHLRALGVEPEVRVALCLERSFDFVVALLAVTKAGGAFVPIDPKTPAARIAFLLEDSAPKLLVRSSATALELPAYAGRVLDLDAERELIDRAPSAAPELALSGTNLAYLIYTSGSTGRPKAVMIEHRGLGNYLRWCVDAYSVADGNGAPVQSSVGVDLTLTSLLAPLLVGRCAWLMPDDPTEFTRALGPSAGHSLVKLTPTELGFVGEALGHGRTRGVTRTLVVGGEALSYEALRAFREYAPETRIFNEYGPTETVVGCAVHEVDGEEPREGPVPIGRPIVNTELYVLDDAGELAPTGVVGELYVGGDGVGRGYFARPELTALRFVPDAFSGRSGARLYATGDRARRRADGVLEYLGRSDTQVKIRGHRVELGEIESRLLQEPGVRAALVTKTPEERLVAYLVADAETSSQALTERLRSELPAYMVPEGWVFLEALPRAASGKVDRRKLPRFEPQPIEKVREPVPPMDPVQRVLSASWCELLGVEHVDPRDDFFELGGNSLLAIRAIARIRDYFRVEFTLRDLLRDPSVAGVAKALSANPERRAEVEAAARLVLELAELDEGEAQRRLAELSAEAKKRS